MATLQVTYMFADGATLSVASQGKSTYPDALDEMRSQAHRLFADVWNSLTEAPVEVEPEK